MSPRVPAAVLPRLAVGLLLVLATAIASAEGDAKRGEYLATAGGCIGCHTEDWKDAARFAGGRALKTPFGTFYGPNITPDNEHGIGRWSEADFFRAMRFGERRDGSNYYPAFPYPSFTRITDDDLRDLWAYLRTLRPSPRANQAHDLRFPFGWRFLVTAWKSLYFTPGPFMQNPDRSATENRGAYLVQALGHCAECHTPRDFLGGPKSRRFLAGGKGLDGKRVPNLTPTRLKTWSDAELRQFFLTGDTPDGDSAAGPMDEVIRTETSRLTAQDRDAMIAYLRTLPALPDEPRTKD
jgi:mono/diheme cytochrome c family protein